MNNCVHRAAVMDSQSRTDRMGSLLATRALRIMDTKLVVHPLHIAALLLHPLFKTLSSMFYADRERDQAKSEGLENFKSAMLETRSAKSTVSKQRDNGEGSNEQGQSAG
jgi:hypothetical protein